MVSMETDVIRVVVVDNHALHRDGTRQLIEDHPDVRVRMHPDNIYAKLGGEFTHRGGRARHLGQAADRQR